MAEHGTRQCYAEGCRRPECSAAQSTYKREWRARRAGAPIDAPKAGRKSKAELASVTQMQPSMSPSPTVGPNEQAVLDELSTLTSAETRKAAAQGALTLARIADNPLEPGPSRKGAVQEFVKILDDLRKGSTRRKGRLASVQAITKTASA
jgi:hypothetical protein